MIDVQAMHQKLQRLTEISDWTFTVGLHIRFANPTLLYTTYPKAWLDYYNANGFVFADPAVKWSMMNTGVSNWSDQAEQDEHNVFGKAYEFGLRYGKTIAIGDSSRSAGFFAHRTRKIEQAEVEQAKVLLEEMHDMTHGVEDMSPNELRPLRELNLALREEVCRSV